jgi:dienelactone hydrolase
LELIVPLVCGCLFYVVVGTYAARRYLAQRGFVDAARIAVLGQSMGGNAALYAVDRDMAAQYFTERFRAVIAYYPACVLPLVTLTAPTLILAGERDDWTPAERCREMVAHARPDSAPTALHVYPGAHHAFDVAGCSPAAARLVTGSNTTSRRPSGDCALPAYHDHPPQRLLQNFPDTTFLKVWASQARRVGKHRNPPS